MKEILTEKLVQWCLYDFIDLRSKSVDWLLYNEHCVKSVRILSFSGLYFPAFGLNTDQKNSEYGPEV